MSESLKNLPFFKLVDTKHSKLSASIIKRHFKTKENMIFFVDQNGKIKTKVIDYNNELIEKHE